MNTVILKVDGSLPGDLTFQLQQPKGGALCFEGKSKSTVEGIKTDPSLLSQLLPSNLARELGQWDLDDPTPGLLAVSSAIRAADGVPWEYLPQLLRLPTVFVVRYLDQPELAHDNTARTACRLVAAGWSGQPTFHLPGIQEELAALNQLATANVEVRV
jgi:hypothetical protein